MTVGRRGVGTCRPSGANGDDDDDGRAKRAHPCDPSKRRAPFQEMRGDTCREGHAEARADTCGTRHASGRPGRDSHVAR